MRKATRRISEATWIYRHLVVPLLALVFTPAGQAASGTPFALAKATYILARGETVKLELPAESQAAVRHGRTLKSRTTPSSQPAPFVTVGSDGDLVIAAPSLTLPGRYTVSFDLVEDDRVRTASVSVSVTTPAPVPVGSGTPVILLNGWQAPSLIPLSTCPTSASDGSQPFGTLPKNLPVWSTFFDNCVECPDCPIEMLATHLAQRIDSLVFSDGTPVEQVDVVAHSMGGLIVRAYLSGKSQTPGLFAPPANPRIRKAVFIGSPHFGSFLATSFGTQSVSLRPGSQFLWDLSRWNQGTDDLREVDALAVVGDAAADSRSDGIVASTSASLDFAGLPDIRTRIIHACHIDGALAFLLLCSTSQGIASSADSQQIVTSFLSGTTAWMSVGHTPSQDSILSRNGGRFVSVVNATDVPQGNVSNMAFNGQSFGRNPDAPAIFYNDFLPAGSGFLTYTSQSQDFRVLAMVGAGGYGPILLKSPPSMAYIRPAAGALQTLNVAPGSLISVFGSGLAAGTTTSSFPWPTHLSDVSLTANGEPLQMLYASGSQINAYFPGNLSGLVTLQLTNSLGRHSLNVMTTGASPAIFSADSSGTGIAAAIHAATGQPVTLSDPAIAGEYVEIYGTGFGGTHELGGFAVTDLSPEVSVGGLPATVSFCGIPEGGVGLYQVNLIVPDGLPAGMNAALSMTLGRYSSNTVMLPVR